MLWLILLIGVNIFTFILWLCLLLLAQSKRRNIEQPVLIVTAHPDDESDTTSTCFASPLGIMVDLAMKESVNWTLQQRNWESGV
ncbi:unnamed protein product [Schistosoma rodhaini]|uniref:N-acetylglucosaminylphosphatidylinositol deacetylase n=1 Tax=Schistosoma rodhaini TaxID=6188 RepID=A0AA85F8E5_9TREM|nr:unnamed protein product [Schistosoma rodhaini]